MTENIFDTSLKYECIEFWKEFILWFLVGVILVIVSILITIIVYCIITYA